MILREWCKTYQDKICEDVRNSRRSGLLHCSHSGPTRNNIDNGEIN